MSLAELLARGRVWFNVSGSDPGAVLRDCVSTLASAGRLSEGLSAEALADSVVAREAAGSTAMGGSIAFPHPKQSMVPQAADASIALFYPRFPVPWAAPDGAPVRAVFLLLSNNPKEHLTALSRLAKACGDAGFRALLMDESGEGALVAYLSGLEAAFLPRPTK